MPLVLEGSELPEATLRQLCTGLKTDLAELEEMVSNPRGGVRDPASLRTATELLHSARSALGSDPSDRAELAAQANLAYAVMLAVIDLVKSHTVGPTVPRRSAPEPSP